MAASNLPNVTSQNQQSNQLLLGTPGLTTNFGANPFSSQNIGTPSSYIQPSTIPLQSSIGNMPGSVSSMVKALQKG